MPTDELPISDEFFLPPDTCIIDCKGDFVAAGVTSLVGLVTSLVGLLPNGDIIKTPWDNPFRDCVQDLATEAKIYQMLGKHPRLVKIRNWDSTEHTMAMEYMPHGTLKQYIKNHYEDFHELYSSDGLDRRPKACNSFMHSTFFTATLVHITSY